MFKKFVLALAAILCCASCYAQDKDAQDMIITITFNNVPHDTNLVTSWGFSAFIEGLEKNILFDTGGDGAILLANMEKLGLDPKEVDILVLSHIHGDHTGGLPDFLEENSEISVYLPSSFPKSFRDGAGKMSKEVVSVDKPVKICERVWSTGEMGRRIKEQSLVIESKQGLVVITGCAHPGVVDIVKKATEILEEDVYLVMGGFHLLEHSERQVVEVIKQLDALGVKKVAPSHCTGERAIELFEEAWGEDFLESGCGARIEVKAGSGAR